MKISKKHVLFSILILTSLLFLTVAIALAGEELTVRGLLVKIDDKNQRITVEDKNNVKTEIVFEDEQAFSKIKKYKIEIMDKVSVRYVIKNKTNIGKKIRSLRGC